MIRVLIADDHPVVREGLKRIVDRDADMEVVAEAVDGAAALAETLAKRPDVILLDVSMPGAGFLETMRRMRAQRPDVQILVLSVHSEDSYAVRAFRAGAAGYLTKDRSPEELSVAIRRVHGGGKYVTVDLHRKLTQVLHPKLTHLEEPEYGSILSGFSSFDRLRLFRRAVFEAVAVVAGLDDMTVMRQSVQ